MAENFTSFTEVDPNSKITKTASTITVAALSRNEDAYVYKDFDVDYFLGNFEIDFALNVGSYGGLGSGVGYLIAMSNAVEELRWLYLNRATEHFWYVYIASALGGGNVQIGIQFYNGGDPPVNDLTGYILSQGTDYYVTVKRDESVGTYGTMYLYLYDDAARTNLLDTLTLTIPNSKVNFRYLYGVQTYNSGGATYHWTGTVSDLDIVSAAYSGGAPTVTVQAVSDVTSSTATGNGNVTDLGSPPATQHGHCWATYANPTTLDSKTENGVPSATGAFTSSITGLKANVYYYVRAYITSDLGTFYSNQTATFTASQGVPDVTTKQVTNIAATTAVGHGSINYDGGSSITAHGVCWSTSSSPTTSDSHTDNGANTELGDFDSLITGLTAGQTYYVRAYATNSTGTGYGSNVTFQANVAGVPIVTTEECTGMTDFTAIGNGTIVSLGGASVTQHGHCWAATVNPTTSDSKTSLGTGAVGSFASQITSLTPGNTYYVRAYATNAYGTAYGDNVTINEGAIAGEVKGNLTILDKYLAYTDSSGNKRALLGVPF